MADGEAPRNFCIDCAGYAPLAAWMASFWGPAGLCGPCVEKLPADAVLDRLERAQEEAEASADAHMVKWATPDEDGFEVRFDAPPPAAPAFDLEVPARLRRPARKPVASARELVLDPRNQVLPPVFRRLAGHGRRLKTGS